MCVRRNITRTFSNSALLSNRVIDVFPSPATHEENFPLAINKRTIRQSGWAVITCAMNNERDGKKADFCGMLKRESLDNGGASRRRGTETKKKRKKQQNSYRLVGEHRFIADIISSENRINVYILMGGNVSIKFRLRSRVWNWILNRGNDFVGPIDWIYFQTNVSNDKKRSG